MMIKYIIGLTFLIISLANVSALAEDDNQLVILVHNSCSLDKIAIKSIRRTYMGVPLIVNDTQIVPALYTGDDLMTEHFMQKVMFMSASNYERMTINNNFRNGRAAPNKLNSLTDVTNYFNENDNAMVILWRKDALAMRVGRVVEF